MNERTFHGGVERLRVPKRLALLEVERVVDLVLDGVDAKNVLDVGTGSGIFAEAFARHGLAVAGIDANPEMVAAAQQHVPVGDMHQASAEALPFSEASFDIAFFGLVLHEADDALKALREARRVAHKRVAVLEWPYRAEEFGPPLAHRFKHEQVTALAQEAGLPRSEVLPLTQLILYRFDL
jgi:ubiquinone/menaquinone biosynthesis C-methylase UbiE